MSSEPTTPHSPATADPIVDFTVRKRSTLAYVLLFLGFLALAAGIYFTVKAWSSTTIADTEKKDTPEIELAGPKRAAVDGDTTRSEHVIGAVAGYLVGIVLVGVGVMMLVGVPKPTLAGMETEARITILMLGGLLGLAFMITGLLLFLYSFSIVLDWTNEKTVPKQAWKPVVAILLFLLGAGLAFLGAQPARTEERNNTMVRRLVYGTNMVLSVFLLLLVLVVGNVIVALKVPNRLDTTSSGFYTLSEPTKEYLAALTTPVKVYTTFNESDQQPYYVDARRLLEAAHEINPSKFQVRFLSRALHTKEINEIKSRFPQVDFNQAPGILLTVGEGEKQYSFIPARDLFERAGGIDPNQQKIIFTGESKLISEVLFLTENKVRPVVYFTTGHGELDIRQATGQDPTRVTQTATQLRDLLEKGNVEVRPLEFGLGEAVVPADAAIVAILNPRSPFSPQQIEAIRKYVSPEKPTDKKGRLVVALSPHPNPDGTGVVETGLEVMLESLGIRVGNEYIYSQALQNYSYTDVLAGITANQLRARNPIAIDLQNEFFLMPNCREVLPAGPPGARSAAVLLASIERLSWLERDPLPNPAKTLETLARDEALRKAKRPSLSSRAVAVTISDGDRGQIIVFGSGEMFADSDQRNPIPSENYQLFTTAVNWLRDRPAVANIAGKTYGEYDPPENVSSVPVFWLPSGITVLGIAALGLGVWVFRRK